MKAIYTNAKILIKTQYIPHVARPRKTPSPCSIWKTHFGEGFFVADYREFFQTNNKSNRQMMSVFIYSSSNL